jgi:hypothetical protein
MRRVPIVEIGERRPDPPASAEAVAVTSPPKAKDAKEGPALDKASASIDSSSSSKPAAAVPAPMPAVAATPTAQTVGEKAKKKITIVESESAPSASRAPLQPEPPATKPTGQPPATSPARPASTSSSTTLPVLASPPLAAGAVTTAAHFERQWKLLGLREARNDFLKVRVVPF